MTEVTTTFNVEMACGGCSNACKRILNKLDGVTGVEPDLDAQTITVTSTEGGDATPEAMLAALLKWGEVAGKSVSLAE
eukprot:CAMPEP_0118852892 /NCGR_PEP_ID=MMETSP1163-20130328/1697_1 /TAXON_ID=124430 /ORGANISM="Phaeomonas parva, Strain CCMP2877" /LENGTH=77 /DNA_ID=CAMNT_0006785363 /DNA_START=220 /DNA_END=453 /DNA_ORIENTATION=-